MQDFMSVVQWNAVSLSCRPQEGMLPLDFSCLSTHIIVATEACSRGSSLVKVDALIHS